MFLLHRFNKSGLYTEHGISVATREPGKAECGVIFFVVRSFKGTKKGTGKAE